MAVAFLPSVAILAPDVAQCAGGVVSTVGTAGVVNGVLNLSTVAILAYVTKITRALDKEVRNGGK